MNYFWFTKSSDSGLSPDNIISKASSNFGPIISLNPYKLKWSVIKLSSTSAKNSWPSTSQNQLIQPSEISSELPLLSII